MANETRVMKLLLRNHLLAQDAIQALVGPRVMGAHPSSADAQNLDYPMVILELNAGRSLYNGIIMQAGFQVLTYSRTSQDEATKLYDLVYAALHAECVEDANLNMSLLCEESVRPREGWNKDTQAWFAIADWLANGAG